MTHNLFKNWFQQSLQKASRSKLSVFFSAGGGGIFQNFSELTSTRKEMSFSF